MGIKFVTKSVEQACVRPCPKRWEESEEQDSCIFSVSRTAHLQPTQWKSAFSET